MNRISSFVSRISYLEKRKSLSLRDTVLITSLFLLCSSVEATPCRKLQETCIEGPSTKNISGVNVTRPCWKFEAQFECATNQYQNFCAALEAHPHCALTNQTCVEKDADDGCRLWQKSFVCGDLLAQREGVTFLNSSYTIVKDALDTRSCDEMHQNPNCTFVREICVEGEATRIINGKPIHKTCWRYQREYTCLGAVHSDCNEIPSNCQKIKSTCLTYDETSNTNNSSSSRTTNHEERTTRCLAWEHQYRCPEPSTRSAPVALDCSGQKFCVNGNCYETGYQNNSDFAKAVTHLSVLKDLQHKLDPQSLSLFKGTPNDCRKWPLNAMNCCSNKGWALDRLASCNDNEKQLHQQQLDGLLHEIGSYCSQKAFNKICTEKKRVYCAFDSKLARIVHEQGRGQIGISWGDPKNPNCRGFTPAELQRLNFERMDLSEYYRDVWQKTQLPNRETLTQKIGERVQSYYRQGVPHAR